VQKAEHYHFHEFYNASGRMRVRNVKHLLRLIKHRIKELMTEKSHLFTICSHIYCEYIQQLGYEINKKILIYILAV